jgi:hypothetical protein
MNTDKALAQDFATIGVAIYGADLLFCGGHCEADHFYNASRTLDRCIGILRGRWHDGP